MLAMYWRGEIGQGAQPVVDVPVHGFGEVAAFGADPGVVLLLVVVVVTVMVLCKLGFYKLMP